MTWLHFFVAGAILERHGLEKSQNALVRGRQLCTQLSIIEGSLAELLRFWCCQLRKMRKSRKSLRFWCCQLRKMRKSRRIASFLMLPTSKIEEVSQNCFVLDVVNFENWGSLAESLRFWCCQLRKSRKSRRIASFLTLPSSHVEEVSQNSFFFKLADRQIHRQIDR